MRLALDETSEATEAMSLIKQEKSDVNTNPFDVNTNPFDVNTQP